MINVTIKYRWLILLSLCLPQLLLAQSDYVAMFNRLTDYETTNEEKSLLSAQLTDSIAVDLNDDVSAFDTLGIRQLRMACSPDSAFKILTWCYVLNDGIAQYGGVVINRGKVVALRYADKPIVVGEEYSADHWCGGVCYEVIPVEIKGKLCYTLLSWDGNDGVTFKRIADVVSFDKKGRAVFGRSVFQNERHVTNRIVLEYSAKTSLTLDYNERHKGIVANAIVHDNDDFSGASASYGASDVFDVYRFESGKWVMYPNERLTFDKEDSKALSPRVVTPEKGL